MFPGRHLGAVAYAPSLPAGVKFLAEGHFLPSIQPMVLIYPRPDSETSPNARHHWAYFDGVNPFMYDVPIDLIGGAWPHVPVLMNAPPGMTILMPNYAAGPPYASPRLQWTPTAAWSGVLWVRWYSQEYQTDQTQYIDQTFLLQTCADISAGGQFIILNKDTGSPAGAGSWASPLDDMPTVFGTSWGQAAILIGGVSVGGKICAMQQSAAQYTLPLYTDGSSAQPHFQTQVQTKPIALIGIPGQTRPKFSVAGAGGVGMGNNTKAQDWFMSYLNPDGYNTLAENFICCSVGGSGDNRITWDRITWTNSGWGNVTYVMATVSNGTLGTAGSVLNVTQFISGAPIVVGQTCSLRGTVNTTTPTIASLGTGSGGLGTYNLSATANIATPTQMALYFGRGNTVAFEAVANASFRQYIYVNDCTETNRQPGNPGNNGAGVDWFSCQYSLIQGWYFNQPTWVGDGGSFFKIQIPNSEIRGCVMICSFLIQAFSPAEYFATADGPFFTLSESKHNVLVSTGTGGGGYVAVPGNATPGYGTLRLGRCSLYSATASGGIRSAPNTGGPYYVTNNAVQTLNTTTPPTGPGSGVVASGNVVQASGLLLTTGALDPSNANYAQYLGTIGATVA